MQRRDFLVSAALIPGVALVPALAGATRSSLAMTPAAAGAAGVGLDPLLASPGAIGTGLDLIGGFRVVDAFDTFHGAMPFVVEGEGERFQLDVLRRTEDGAAGMHASEHFAIFAHGAGNPAQERGARALAWALERELRAGTPVPVLASFEERQSAASGAKLHVDFVRTAEALV